VVPAPGRHLWEYNDQPGDPRGGSDNNVQFDDLDELQANVARTLGPLNIPYSWNWFPLDESGEPDDTETFQISIAMAYQTVNWACPITRDQEPQVRQLLAECGRYHHAIWTTT
jgi:hypothetical protein